MNTRYSSYLKLAALAATLSLAGCLSDSDNSEFAGKPDAPSGSTNQAPTISGNPPSGVKVGEGYSFTPNASDADGDTLTFSITNKPNWASFNTSNGSLTGTPTLANVGSFAS